MQRPVREVRIGPLQHLPVQMTSLAATPGMEIPIANPGDDGDFNGGFDNASNDIELGNTGAAKKGFFLFRNTGIPQGVTIEEAYLVITSSANLNAVTVNLIINASDEDNPTTPGNVADANGRPRTTAQVAWNNIAAWTSNTEYQSPDISTIVQELVDRAGFASDNVLIFFEDNGSTANASRKGHSYNGDPARAARLHVSYSTEAPPAATCPNHLTGTYAALPAASSAGRIYLPSDAFAKYLDDGAAWSAWGPTFGQRAVQSSGFDWINQGASTIDETYGGLYLYTPAVAGSNLRILKKAAPSTPYTITAAILTDIARYDFLAFGILFRQSSDGKIAIEKVRGAAHAISGIEVVKYTDPSTVSATYTTVSIALMPIVWWFRIEDDGVDRISSFSYDGHSWYELHSVGRTDFLTADEVGFAIESNNATYGMGVNILSWEES